MANAKLIFSNVEDEKEILVKLSTFSQCELKRGKTLVFLDEIQGCPEAVTYIKFLVQDGTCHYILSGSLLGVELKDVRSVPVGLLSATYMDGIQLKILNSEIDVNFGAVYENVVAQELLAHGFAPAYYASRTHGEIDFVVEKDGHALPIEVKSGKHYRRHRALNHVLAERKYAINDAIVFDDAVLTVANGIFYAPVYMVMFLEKDTLPEKLIYEVGAPLQSFPAP